MNYFFAFFNITLLLLLIILTCIKLYDANYLFQQIYIRIVQSQNEFIKCIKNNLYKSCNNISFDLFKDKYDKYFCEKNANCPIFPHNNTLLNSDVLYEPTIRYDIDYLFIVQIGPSDLSSRILFRKIFPRYNNMLNKRIGYLFFMGFPYIQSNKQRKRITDIPLNILLKEFYVYRDMLIFNFTNSYFCITLQLFSVYKWIVNSNLYVKKIIRFDSNSIVYENELATLLKKDYDLQGFPCRTKLYYNRSILYPQGSFHILSIKLVRLLIKYYNYSIIVKSNDITTGLILYNIIQNKSKIKINWLNSDRIDLLINWHNYKIKIYNNTIALHPLTLSSREYYLNYKSYMIEK